MSGGRWGTTPLSDLLAPLPEDLESFHHLARRIDRWGELIDLAADHGLGDVLHDALDRSGAIVYAPAPIIECLEERRTFERARARHHGRALDEVLRAIAAAGIRAVSLKGPVLGERLYPPGIIRPSTDIDLLVGEEQLGALVETLELIGYRAAETPGVAKARAWVHHLELDRPGSPAVEAHFRLHSEFAAELPAEPFLARAERYVTQAGAQPWVLAPEDELVYLALHAAAHRCVRLGWLFDLELLVAARPKLDWSLAETRAREAGAWSAAAFALAAANRRLGVPIPSSLMLPPGDPRARIAELLASERATHQGPIALQRLTSFAFAALLCDDGVQSLRSMRHLFARFGARQANAILRGLRR